MATHCRPILQQLKLFEKMKCSLDLENKLYTSWHTKAAADHAALQEKVANMPAVEISDTKHVQQLSALLMQRAGSIDFSRCL